MSGDHSESTPQSLALMDSSVAQSRSAFGYVKFRVWLAGSFAAMAGFRLNQVALTVLVFDITGVDHAGDAAPAAKSGWTPRDCRMNYSSDVSARELAATVSFPSRIWT